MEQNDTVLIGVFALLGFAFFAFALGAQLPLKELLKLIERHTRETALLVALSVFLGFLLKLTTH